MDPLNFGQGGVHNLAYLIDLNGRQVEEFHGIGYGYGFELEFWGFV